MQTSIGMYEVTQHDEPKKKNMVTRLWKGLSSGLKTEDIASLHISQWQSHKKVLLLYLFYRWICAIIFLTMIVCSVIEIGRGGEKFEHHYAKWWIYLTHWTVLICVLQGWLSAVICTKALMDNNRDYEFVLQTKVGYVQQFYWICYSVGTVYAFIVTFLYWTTVYNPEVDTFDLINFFVHTVLAVIMFADLLLVGHPVRMDPDLYFSTGLGLAYSIFSLIYYLCGGTDRQNDTVIYPLVNWEKPGKTIVVCVGAIFFVVIVHILCCCVCKIRYLIHKKIFVKKEKKLNTCKEHAKMLSEQKDFTIPSVLDLK
ncbi:protein rolling stone isoform X1 [Chironomus tepperi]|uniref:protein rolling stone isoform X1 n=2 Tax=Chironomus tepperi TaxID=113505 RepID=UPI00391EF955